MEENRSVLVTGCSSGIGYHTALTLAGKGFTVFATVRKPLDEYLLSCMGIPNLIPVFLVDLAKPEEITEAHKFIGEEISKRGITGLYAIVNNAGGGKPSPIELMDLDLFHTELQARLLGSIQLLQLLLPLVREANGRIVWIMTPAMIPTPYVASIHACDFAVNCIARTLDIELKQWKIPNIMIRCGGIKTPAGLRTTSDIEAVLQNSDPNRIKYYEKALNKWREDMLKFDTKRTEPEKVARVVLKTLLTKKPKKHYSIGYMSKAAGFLEALPQSLTDRILKSRF
jgi:NAD(P)-dependent dehydrogenase (short-subunit alcohol dehydrogenase family)